MGPRKRNKEKKQKDIPIEKNEAKRTEEPTSLEIVRNGSFAVEKGFLDALYQPHTVTGLLITFTAMIYFGFLQENDSMVASGRAGVGLASVVFLFYCSIQIRDGLIVRPHPVIWRIIHGSAIIYLVGLVFVLVQKQGEAQQALRFIDQSLGIPLPERSYATDCRLITPENKISKFANILGTLDAFIVAHSLGWVAKALMLRSWFLCFTLSILFEVLEVTFQHILPNFKECWWDHLILDAFGCNLIGIIIGMGISKAMEVKKFNWVGMYRISTARGKIGRVVMQFTPFSWTKYQWNVFSSPSLFFQIIFLIFLMEVVELNAFFLKTSLWIPVSNPFNTCRLVLWFFLSIPALHECYHYIQDTSPSRRLGQNAWLAAAIAFVEALIIVKFGRSQGLFNIETPSVVYWSWTIFFGLLLIWSIGYFGVKKKLQQVQDAEYSQQLAVYFSGILDMFTIVVPIPLIFLLAHDCWSTINMNQTV